MKSDEKIISLLTEIRDLQKQQITNAEKNLEKAAIQYDTYLKNTKVLQRNFLKKVIVAIIVFLVISSLLITKI